MSVIQGRAGGVSRCGLLAALAAAMVAVQVVLRGEADLRTQIVGQLVAFVIFVPALALCWRGLRAGWWGLVVVLVAAAAFRAVAFVPDATPPLSDDLHRYAWDARVQAAGINPYRHAPDAPELTGLRDGDVWVGVNRKSWTTIYPPAAQASFLAARAAFGDRLRSTTMLFLLAEVAASALLVLTLLRLGAPPERVAAYAWHPLAISEIAGNGHVDALAVLGLAALLWAWSGHRRAVAGAALAVAALVKLGPALLVPVLARAGGRRFTAVAVGVGLALYIPYLSVGTGVVGSIGRYAEAEQFNGSLTKLLFPGLGETGARALLALGLGLLIVIVALREHESVEQVARSGLLVLGGLIYCLDYVQPWYALWLLPLCAITLAPGWIWLAGLLPLAYVYGLDPGQPLPLWVPLAIYAPPMAIGLARAFARRGPAQTPGLLPERPRAVAVIPVLDEEAALRGLFAEWPAGVVDEVIVVDGGSRDASAAVARAAGARVVAEPRRGYGRACASGAAATDADIVVFLDGDGSCDPADLAAVIAPVRAGQAALSLGRRAHHEAGAMPAHQRLGNLAVAAILRATHGLRVADVPCMRAIRADSLADLEMREMTYGWPTEMIARSARARLAIVEVPTCFRARRGGRSKVGGRPVASARAGARMIRVALRQA